MSSLVEDDVLYIDTPQALASLCALFKDNEWIALDTEFMRERTYYPRLCLLQVATPAVLACVDPLALKDHLAPLLDVIYNTRITKVLHAAYQDLEIFYHLRGAPPKPVFDTQIAASLLGFGEQVGYASLVQQALNVQLPKAHSRSDWCLRPLDAAQLRYAADDVRYLNLLYPRLRALLASKKRLDWLTDDFTRLCDTDTYRLDIDNAWQRVGGLQSLKPRQLNILRALAAWREREAASRDMPRKWVLADAVLLDLARLAPRDQEALTRMRGIQKGQVERHGAAIIATIGPALKAPEADWPRPPPRRLLTPAQEATVDMLMALVRNQAALHEVSPAAIATRSALERLVLGDTDVPVLHGWRAQIAGSTLSKMLAGALRVGMQGSALRVEEIHSPDG
jgi:ribonuclease D